MIKAGGAHGMKAERHEILETVYELQSMPVVARSDSP